MARGVVDAQALRAIDDAFADAAALNVTVCVASGDRGSSDEVEQDGLQHVLFPASSPHVLAVGGLRCTGSASPRLGPRLRGTAPAVGSARDSHCRPGRLRPVCPEPGRCHPIRSGGAGRGGRRESRLGISVRVGGRDISVGGTSAATPLWAALICRYAEILGSRFGLLQTAVYDGVTAGHTARGFRDITVGSNGAYSAGTGWNACTGLGAPEGDVLRAVLSNHVSRDNPLIS